MQTLTKALLLGFLLGLANIAAAEHFNDKSTIASTNYPAPPSMAENYPSSALSNEFKETSPWVTVVPSEGPVLCSVNPPWSKASKDPYRIADRFNDKYSNRC
jgi:hypothetical protein